MLAEDAPFIIKRLRGLFGLILLIVIVDWGSKHLLLPLVGAQPAVYNPSDPGLLYLGLILACGILLVSGTRSSLILLFCGLLCGGAAANILDSHLFGPVADFIHRPFSDYYFNLADFFLMLALIPLALLVFSRVKSTRF